MIKKLIWLILFFTIINAPSIASDYRYNFKDLEALLETNNFQEFFTHIYDIRPSERTKPWETMVMAMSEKYISFLNKNNIKNEDFNLLTKIFSISHLRRDEFFRQKRDNVLIKYLSQIKDKTSADELVNKAARLGIEYNENLNFQHQIIKIIYPKLQAENVLLKHFDKLITISNKITADPFSEFYCDKEPLISLIKDQLYYNKDISHFDKSCIKKIIPSLRKDLKNENIIKRKMAYLFLKKKAKLSQEEEATYHVYNLVYGNKYQKDEWDQVFSSLRYLGENHQYRVKILNELAAHDPFPDIVFKIHDKKQTIGLSRVISRYFPEYLDRYAQHCLSFLSGETRYPNGNPTPNCHRYMQISQQSKSSPTTVLERYDEIMNSWKK
jgi:hypothetical protein